MDAVHISVLCCVVITATNSNCGSPLAIIMPFILQHPCNDPPLWPLGFDSFLTAFVLCGVTSSQPYKGLTTHFGPSFQSAFSYPVVETFQWLTVFMAFDFRKINKLATFLFHNGSLVAKSQPPTITLQSWIIHVISRLTELCRYSFECSIFSPFLEQSLNLATWPAIPLACLPLMGV